jgi:SAM-dependent methyltransferase
MAGAGPAGSFAGMAYDGRDPELDSADGYEERRTSFGRQAATYDAVRPEWPAGTIRWLVGDLAAGSPVLDLGAGTGKGTRTLVELGLRPTAVDPSEGMLAVLRERVPGADARIGTATAIPLPDRSVDAVISLQAWHWFDSLAAAAECARVLRPGGTLGVAWHVRDERVPWVAAVSDAGGRREDGTADRRGVRPPQVGDAFGPVESAVLPYELAVDVDGLVALASSWSYVDLAPDREQRLAAVRRVAETAAVDGRLVIPHRTFCYRWRVR